MRGGGSGNQRQRRALWPSLVAAALVAFLAGPAIAGTVVDHEADMAVEYVPADRQRARTAVRLYRIARERVQKRLGRDVASPPLVVIAPTSRSYESRVLQDTGQTPPVWSLAVAIPRQHLVIIRGPSLQPASPNDLSEALTHEVAHLALHPVSKKRGTPLPSWLEEGLASWTAGGTLTRARRAELRGRARRGTLLSLRSLNRGFPADPATARLAYDQTQALLSWIEEQGGGEHAIRALLDALEAGYTPDGALGQVLEKSLLETEEGFRASLSSERRWWLDVILQLDIFAVMALLALAAIARYLLRRRQLLAEMSAAESAPAQRAGFRLVDKQDS